MVRQKPLSAYSFYKTPYFNNGKRPLISRIKNSLQKTIKNIQSIVFNEINVENTF